jgi:hypothetical protein
LDRWTMRAPASAPPSWRSTSPSNTHWTMDEYRHDRDGWPRLRLTHSRGNRRPRGGQRLEAGLPRHRSIAPRLRPVLAARELARSHDDAAAYAHFRDRYRDIARARTLGFEGHIAAEAMP